MQRLTTILCELLGMCPLKWNPLKERFEMCHVRYIYSTLLSLLLTIIDPISILFLLDFFGAFHNATILTYVCLLDYFTSFTAFLSIHAAQAHSPQTLVILCNEVRRFYLAIDSQHRRQTLKRFARNRSILSFLIAGIVMGTNVLCINYLAKKPTTLLALAASILASLPTLAVTLILVIYNSTMYLTLETFQQINRRLQTVMDALQEIVDQDDLKHLYHRHHSLVADDKARGSRVRNFRKLKNFCDIAEQIDALAISHKDTLDFLRNFNSHYGLVMLVFVLNVFCSIVSQAFFCYMNVAVVIGKVNGEEDGVRVDLQFSGGSVVYALMATVQMLFVVEATSAVIDVGRVTGLKLHQVVAANLDERLEQSVRSNGFWFIFIQCVLFCRSNSSPSRYWSRR